MVKTSIVKMIAMLPILGVAGLVAACQTSTQENEQQTAMAELQEMTITGSAAYRERIALAPGGVFTVSLEDVSLADASSTRLAEYSLTLNGEQVPLPFTLTVKEHKIKTNMRYAVRATIRGADGALEWSTDTAYLIDPALTAQDLGVLELVRVGASPADNSANAGATIIGAMWQVEDINGGGVIDNSHVTMNFDATGKVTGSTGCNNYFGGYAIEADTLTIDALGSTRRACAPALMDQEAKFLAILQDAASWSFDAVGRVTLKTEDGRTLQAIVATPAQ